MATPQLPQLVSVLVVLRAVAHMCWHVLTLPHVVTAISDCLDHARPKFWTLPRACDANLLSLLHRLAARGVSDGVDPHYWRYQCNQGLVSAVKNDNLEMVEWLHAFCPDVLPYASMIEAARTGNIRMLEWLSNRHEHVVWLPHMVDATASTGQTDVLEWLHSLPNNAAYDAIRNGHSDVVKFLFSHPQQYGVDFLIGINCDAIVGDLEMVQWLYTEFAAVARCDSDRFNPISCAARGDHLHAIQWLHKHHPNGCSPAAMGNAAQHGHLRVVQWLHENRTKGCTSEAMNDAASNGHLEVVQWLHENRTEGCSVDAMDCAAKNDHFEIVQWLHKNRAEGCTEYAMDYAASNGDLGILRWLHENRDEGCTTEAMKFTVTYGHFDIVLFLHENRTEGCDSNSITDADTYIKYMEIIQWLNEHYPGSLVIDEMRSRTGYMSAVLDHILGVPAADEH